MLNHAALGEATVEASPYSNRLFLYVNQTPYELVNPAPETTVLQFLRDQGLTGTKLGCAEGGCGACTIVIASLDPTTLRISHRSANGCLLPLCSLDGKQVITIEGIGNSKQPHPVQERLAALHGSQCGFCTPGIAMSLYALLRNNPEPTDHDIEDGFDGNLCRCTGYRPILDAAKTFSVAHDDPSPSPPSACPGQHSCGKSRCSEQEHLECRQKHADQIDDIEELQPIRLLEKHQFAPYEPATEMAFPEALVQYGQKRLSSAATSLRFRGKWCSDFYSPTSLDELLRIKNQFPSCKLLSGNTEVGIETKFKYQVYNVRAFVGDIPELTTVHVDGVGVKFGANITLSALEDELTKLANTLEAHQTEGHKAILTNLKWFAGRQVRNFATMAGNIATASPISDLNPVLIACQAVVTIQSLDAPPREVPMSKFFLGYRKTALQPHEVLTQVFIPHSQPGQYIRAYKQAKRKDDDIAIVNAGLSIQLDSDPEGHWWVRDCSMAFAGMGPISVQSKATEQHLVGSDFANPETLNSLMTVCQQELRLDPGAPGGMAEYRLALASSFVFKFWHEISCLIQVNGFSAKQGHDTMEITRELSKGLQYYAETR
ncbi:hypothetical protein BJ085DRAFT_41134 [Dimargaris cristalligena]|uniref:Xanthine dehydrogenase n=1 Tax=Dimargaris cristalligena TaxID=215637 RepID=A0A4P9ZQ20_9FUNG|nr:hypothetical protein BJ085DRAFT_41134 [Dimargaris cristalligena]|eukprot:RKP35355.1 hypothetical protein BJ085DRAFT_41134 [Dimargaris cristalligena]